MASRVNSDTKCCTGWGVLKREEQMDGRLTASLVLRSIGTQVAGSPSAELQHRSQRISKCRIIDLGHVLHALLDSFSSILLLLFCC